MKKPSWKALLLLFLVALCATTAPFAAYHVLRVKYPAVKTWLDTSALDSNAITAYFTAMAFIGFLITSIYQAYWNTVTEQELDEEKKRRERLEHDSMWLSVQFARLRVFSELKDEVKLASTIREIESHWARLSQWMEDEKSGVEPDGLVNGRRPICAETNRASSA